MTRAFIFYSKTFLIERDLGAFVPAHSFPRDRNMVEDYRASKPGKFRRAKIDKEAPKRVQRKKFVARHDRIVQ